MPRSIVQDAACVHSARVELARLLAELRRRPLHPATVGALRQWIETTYPAAWEALRRLSDESEVAPHFPTGLDSLGWPDDDAARARRAEPRAEGT